MDCDAFLDYVETLLNSSNDLQRLYPLLDHPMWMQYKNDALVCACLVVDDDVECIKWFLENGAEPDYKHDHPLFSACKSGNVNIAKYLLTLDSVREYAHWNGNRSLYIVELHEWDDDLRNKLLEIPEVADLYENY
jgi:hypothetical protein